MMDEEEITRVKRRGGEDYLRAVRENVAKAQGYENYAEVAERRAQGAIIARIKQEDGKEPSR